MRKLTDDPIVRKDIEDRLYTPAEWEDICAKAQNDGNDEFFSIKANIPGTLAAYERGAGGDIEGVWIFIDAKTKQQYASNSTQGTFYALLGNESVFLPALNDFAFNYENETPRPLKFEHRGSERPVLAKEHLDQFL